MNSVMISKIRIIFICLLFFFTVSTSLKGQVKNIGLPLINNFPRSVYKASTQNWDITQNSLGFIYFANNDGMLEFDGQHWNTFPMPNKSIVRAVKSINDTIYTGAFEEFGYFAPNNHGTMVYTSLKNMVPEQFKNFDEIWKIHKVPEGVVFQSFKFMFLFNGKELKTIKPLQSYGHSFSLGNDFFYVEHPNNLWRNNSGNPKHILTDEIFSASELRCILPFGSNSYLLGFINEGLFLLKDGKISPWSGPVNELLQKSSIFSGVKLSGGYMAFGTIQDGLYIVDELGRVIQHLNRFKGLQNNTILSLFEDKSGNLWSGLDNGIDYVEINSPISVFDHTFHIESTYASVVFNDVLYVGTNQGLFYKPLYELVKRENPDVFRFIEGTEGQVWKLETVAGTLLCGHNFGLFQIIDKKAVKIAQERGYWSFQKINQQADSLLCGTYNGLTVIVLKNGKWHQSHLVDGFSESSKSFIYDDASKKVWMAHGYRGLYKLQLSNDLMHVESFQLYAGNHGLPQDLPYNLLSLNKTVLFSTSDGIKTFDEATKEFKTIDAEKDIFNESHRIDQVVSDVNGNIWYFSDGRMALLRLIDDGTYSKVTAPFMRINNTLIQAFENVYIFDNRNVFVGTKNGLVHYDPYFRKDYYRSDALIFREIAFSRGNDQLLKTNVIFSNTETKPDQNNLFAKIPFSHNDLRISFANPVYEGTGNCQFSFRLNGLEENWSDWSVVTFKEYMNLPEGTYSFELKARSLNYPDEKNSVFTFTIQPPFYRSLLAYVIYVLLLIAVVIGNVIFIQRRVTLTKLQEKEKHSKALREQELSFREQALMAEKEIINLRNESLQSQVIHKNKELANTTLHLIHKNKILNAIKSQLNTLADSTLSQTKKGQIDGIINKINRELKNEKFQQAFDEYFDDVHQDFITRLKDRHPELTPRELRLCAYLKMNLSTKEIAPLMNISVRGVEIGRYRLRKKLELERDDNLIDYLLKL